MIEKIKFKGCGSKHCTIFKGVLDLRCLCRDGMFIEELKILKAQNKVLREGLQTVAYSFKYDTAEKAFDKLVETLAKAKANESGGV